jgi:hypothetical protein
MLAAGSNKLFGTNLLGTYLEMTDVKTLNNNYNSTSNGRGKFSVVADPEQTRVTQAYLDIKPVKGLLIRSGRQMVNLDNQRFIGAVGWRQMPQTFDAHLLSYTGIANLSLAGAYVTGVHTIFADKKKGTYGNDRGNTNSVVLHSTYKVSNAVKVTAYDYMIGSAHDTYGLAITGKPKVSNNLTLNYRVEHAIQADPTMKNEDRPEEDVEADANYYNVAVGMNLSGVLAGVNYEQLSGKKENASFSTPLATKHKFNGWADKFLKTPDQGLIDSNFMLGYKSKSTGVMKVIYHEYKSETGKDVDYGTEVNAVYKRGIPGLNGLVGMLKYADYKADKHSVDSKKIWVMLDYKFSSK